LSVREIYAVLIVGEEEKIGVSTDVSPFPERVGRFLEEDGPTDTSWTTGRIELKLFLHCY